MNEKYTLYNKPEFKDGELVLVDMEPLGFPPEIRQGKIVGKTFVFLYTYNVFDTWLVEFDNDFAPTYPYKVVGIPHFCILIKQDDAEPALNKQPEVFGWDARG